ncbi:MAG TPA: iron ABC transporter, partial [Firmicutes bacterium]|nr:iron ABC transporter [Bacillota bacterium]
MSRSRALKTRVAFLVIAMLVVVGWAVSAGTAGIHTGLALRIIISRIPLLGRTLPLGLGSIDPEMLESAEIIVLEVRLPRIVLGLLVGAGLAATGASFQGLFRNPLADPYIIGASSGAALGASIGILSAGRAGLAALSTPSSYIPIFAFIGAVITVVFVYALSTVDGHMPTDTFLLAGVVVGSFVWAMVSFLMVTAGG